MARPPLVGITANYRVVEAAQGRYELKSQYCAAVAAAGGGPVILPDESALARRYATICDAFILSGGADVRMEAFGQVTHPAAEPIEPRRQDFEMALLAALDGRPEKPVLGICLGMQLMALHAGGRLHQHLPEVVASAPAHQADRRHGVRLLVQDSVLSPLWRTAGADEAVPSAHHQAVAEPGALRVVAVAEDGVVEAVDDPRRPWYAGVQWHPERGGPGALNAGLFRLLVDAAAAPN